MEKSVVEGAKALWRKKRGGNERHGWVLCARFSGGAGDWAARRGREAAG